MFGLKTKYGQSTAEYVVILGVVVSVVVAMQVYVKRGLQGRIKQATDYVDNAKDEVTGDSWVPSFTKEAQYEPYYATSSVTREQDKKLRKTMEAGGKVTRAVQSEIAIEEAGGYHETAAPVETKDIPKQ